MKYHIITPVIGKDSDKVLAVFRVTDRGLPEEWIAKDKAWVYKPYLWDYVTMQNLCSNEITVARAAQLIGINSGSL